MELPDDHPRRDEHLAAFRAIRAERPALVIPGHNPAAPLVEGRLRMRGYGADAAKHPLSPAARCRTRRGVVT